MVKLNSWQLDIIIDSIDDIDRIISDVKNA